MMTSIFALSLSLLACGDGIDSDVQVADMTTEDWMAYCQWSSDLMPEVTEVDCGDGTTVTYGTGDLDECVAEGEVFSPAATECDLTVGDLQACDEAVAADPCIGMFSEECGALWECAFSGM